MVETPNPQQEVVAFQSEPTDNVFSAPNGLNLNAPTLRLLSSNRGLQVGDQFILSIEADQVKDLFSAPFYLKYDPQLLEFIGLTEGKFLNQDGKPTVFIYSVDPDTGQVIIGLSRLGDVGGISGSGVLALATFKAKNPGMANVAFQNVDFRDIQLEPVNVISESGEVQVR
jgi:general secretion pathway protein D